MASLFDKIYARSPLWLQNLGISLFGLVWEHRRLGGIFQEKLKQFTERETYTPEQWRVFQRQQLQLILTNVFMNVPYYRRVYNAMGVTEQDIREIGLDELSKLPVIEKQNIRDQPDAFLSKKANPKKLHTYLTSGTTGTPLAIRWSTKMQQTWAAAYEARCRRWAGVNYKMSRAMIGGRLVVPKAVSKGPFWRYNLIERQLYMSAFHISPQNAPRYAEALNKYRPDYLVGYASSHYFLAKLLNDQNIPVHQPKAVLTSSEKLTCEMRSIIQSVYQCEVFDAYSGVEACCLASECEFHNMHISPDVGIIELLDEKDQPVEVGQPGQIVATGLLNYDQPLIRYKTGDWAALSTDPCPCGRSMPVIKDLIGRMEDMVIGPDGRRMVRFHGIFVGLPKIIEGQVIQEDYSRFRLKLVVEPGFGDAEKQIIEKRFFERLGKIDLYIELTDRIERTERGKFRAVVSKIVD